MKRALLIAAVLALAAPALAAPTDDVAALHWMAGDWIQEKGGVTTKEHWSIAPNGAMTGVGETLRPDKPPNVERMRITAEPAGATFTALVDNQPPTAFVRKPGPAGEAVFENLTHDFPQRVIYRRCEADMCARIEGTVNGQLRGQDWRYRRAK